MPAYNKQDLDRRMHGALDVFKHDLAGLRTGRASTALLDPIQVDVYGAMMPINQVATVSVPEARLLSVIFFNYAFTSQRLALGLTLTLETFLPMVILAIFLQRLQRRLQY